MVEGKRERTEWSSLRIAAWNVRRLSKKREVAVATAAIELGADVIALSEWKPEASELIHERLNASGWHHCECLHTSLLQDREVTPKTWGLALYSRQPVERVKIESPVDAPASWLEVYLPAQSITLVATRLISPPPESLWPWFHAQAERLVDQRAVIVGDLNARPDGPKIEPLTSGGWVDALAAAGPANSRSFWGSSGGGGRPDHVLVTPQVANQVRSAGVATRTKNTRMAGAPEAISDHGAVWADILIAE